MTLKKITKYALWIVLVFLSGCAIITPQQRALDKKLTWPQRAASLRKINNWIISGRIGIRTPKGGESASYHWQQKGKQDYAILLTAPLGVGSARIEGKPGKVTFQSSKHPKKITAQNIQSLLRAQLGWYLPIKNLYYWIRGLPAPQLPAKVHWDAYHHIQDLIQQGWHIQYTRYTAVKGADLPREIYLRYRDLKLKIIISNWRLT